MQQSKRLDFLINAAYFSTIGIIIILVAKFLLPWFWPFLSALLLATLFKKVAIMIKKDTKPAIAIIGSLFYVCFISLLWMIFIVISSNLVDAAEIIPAYFSDVFLPWVNQSATAMEQLLIRFFPDTAMSTGELLETFSVAMQQGVAGLSSYLISTVTGLVKMLPTFFIGFIFMVVSSFAISMDYNRVTGFLSRQLPTKFQKVWVEVKDFAISCLFKLSRAYLFIMAFTFFEISLGLWALRIDGFFKYAAIIAVLDFFPLVGAGAVLIPWGIVELIYGRYALGVGLIVLYFIVVVMRNIIEPRVIGDSLGLHPVVTLTAMFVGLKVIGIAGMIIAPALALLVRYLVKSKTIKFYNE